MRTTITTILTLLWVGAPSVYGQVDNCLELVRLSRTESRTTMNQEQFSNTIESFCNEYRSARSQNRSLNLDLRVSRCGFREWFRGHCEFPLHEILQQKHGPAP